MHFLTGELLESDILSSQPVILVEKLREWLPKLENWTPCWRATRDGWLSHFFHDHCDHKKPTLTVVKVVKDKKTYVFGGYSTAFWDVSMYLKQQ